jgi:hypothetical protein
MIQPLRDPLDDTAFARGITALEDDRHPQALALDPLL